MDFLNLLKSVAIGIIEGVTEWLPISSTGHMILADEFIKLSASDAFKEMFLVVIQLGAILAVAFLYFKKLNPFKKDPGERKDVLILWAKVIAACLPAAVIGLLFDDLIDSLFYNYRTVAITLIVYGIAFIYLEKTNESKTFTTNDLKDLTFKKALMIGFFQLLSLIPGTSRSGATILGAMLIGSSRAVAAEFSFFLAIPVMFGASALKLLKFGFVFGQSEVALLATGMVTAFIVSVLAIKFLVGYIKGHDFKAFGWYRIILGVVVIAYFLFVG
ncbi:MAG: undecaprenyl-diphosphate phosphatase [Clostridiales bacterium]|nr:undecaprenyl-diphosphate phosphatase [Clostridiales bacterium]MDR2749817.1 undecaprenyl-diphosphate phosphatase [Clostridiales bacterium]